MTNQINDDGLEAAYNSIIWLTKDRYTIVDNEDYTDLVSFKWHARLNGSKNNFYASRKPAKKMISIHRVVTGADEGQIIDHINRNSLDNRKANLRICTTAENTRNSKIFKTNKSGFKGVSLVKGYQLYEAKITHNRKVHWLGSAKNPEDAARIYDEAAIKYHGEFALTNKMLGLL